MNRPMERAVVRARVVDVFPQLHIAQRLFEPRSADSMRLINIVRPCQIERPLADSAREPGRKGRLGGSLPDFR